MKYTRILALALTLSSMGASAQNVTVHKQGGIGHAYEIGQVDSVVYFPIGDKEQFPAPAGDTTTLWDAIQADPNLSKFAAIADAATYYAAKDRPTNMKFSQLLGSTWQMEVYAPTDQTISDQLYARLMDEAKNDGWKLQQEFLAHHIALYQGQRGHSRCTTMLNGAVIDMTQRPSFTFKSTANGLLFGQSGIWPFAYNLKDYLWTQALDCSKAQQFLAATDTTYLDLAKSVSIPTKDGSTHILDSVFATRHRMMESWLANDDMVRIKGFGRDLADEHVWCHVPQDYFDMVMPTDQVWDDAVSKLTPLYQYASRYEDKVRGDVSTSTYYVTIQNPDSLQSLSMSADILTSLLGKKTAKDPILLSNGQAYAAADYPVPVSEYMPNIEVELEPDRMDTVAYHTFMIDSIGRSYVVWPIQSYEGMPQDKHGNRYESDRYVYNEEMDEYKAIEYYHDSIAYDTIYFEDGSINWINENYIRVEELRHVSLTRIELPEIKQQMKLFYQTSNSSRYKAGSATMMYPFDNQRYAEIADRYGRVSGNGFYYLQPPGATSNPHVEIKLQGDNGEQVMSGKYDIQVVLVPDWYRRLSHNISYEYSGSYFFSADEKDQDEYRGHYSPKELVPGDIPEEWRDPETGLLNDEYIDSLAAVSQYKFKTSISYNNGATTGKDYTTKAVTSTYDGLKVDTITIAEDFEFPYSYKNMASSYPTLIIEGATTKTDARNGYIYSLCIDKIILRNKEDDDYFEMYP